MMWIVWVIGAVWMVGCMALIWEARRTPITPSDYANEPRIGTGSEKAEQHTVRTDTNIARTADSERKEAAIENVWKNWNRGIATRAYTAPKKATRMYPAAYVRRLHARIANLQAKLQAAEAGKGIGFYNGRTDNE